MLKRSYNFCCNFLLIIFGTAICLASTCTSSTCPDSHGNRAEILVMHANGENVTEKHFGQKHIFMHYFKPSEKTSSETLQSNSTGQTVVFLIDGKIEYMSEDCGMQHIIENLSVQTTFKSFEIIKTDENLARWRILLYE